MTHTDTSRLVMGIDLGGTNTVFGLVDRSGSVLATTSIKTAAYQDADDFANAAATAARQLIADTGAEGRVSAIGIGAPNANYYRGTIENAPNIAWAHDTTVPLADMLSRLTGLPVAMTNDANAAAIGEMTYGAARGMSDFIMLTLGTGVGSGIVANGQLIYGHDGFAGELGHVIMRRDNGRACGCGRHGCLETYCSATGVARTARELLATTDEPSLLRELDAERLTSLDVSIAAQRGDALALRVYETTGEMLGEACADFATFSSPEAFIFFGGLTKAGDLLMKPIERGYEKHALNVFKGKPKFLVSQLDGASAAVLGASALGWEILDKRTGGVKNV